MTRSLPFCVLMAALAGCSTVKPEPLPPAPRILSFTATPSTLEAPGKVTLSWETQDATRVELRDGTGVALEGVDNPGSGSVEVQVKSDALFVLAARNDRGVVDTAARQVSVAASPREILFVATPGSIAAGETAVLAWSVPGAKAVSVAPEGGAPVDLKGQGNVGAVSVSPEKTTTYVLTVGREQRPATVTVSPSILALSANPPAAKAGAPLVISWTTLGATKVTLQTPSGQVVATETDAAKVKQGSTSIDIPERANPTDIFAYALVAEVEGGGSAQKAISVYLSGTPVITSLTVPEYGRTGGTFTLSWTTQEADIVQVLAGSAVLFESPTAATAAAGSVAIKTPAMPTTYTLRARNLRGGEVSQTRSVSPVGTTTLGSFDANAPAVLNGGTPVSLTWNIPGARRLKISVANQYTVFSVRGPAAETGTMNVYPNENTEYTLDADNTLNDVVQAKRTVTLTTKATFTAPAGSLLQGNAAPLSYTVGGAAAPIHGLSHFDVDKNLASTGFVDIKATGTKVAFTSADDTTASFVIPANEFETWLFGARATGTVTVGTNGFFIFGSFFSTRPANESMPTQNADTQFLAPFWDDLVLGNGAAYWQIVGEAPEKKLIVQWDDVKLKAEATSSLTFQAQVSQQGVVTYEYKTVTTTAASVTIGAQGPLKTMGFTYGGALPTSGSSLTLFGPKVSPVGPVLQELGPYVGWVKIGSQYLKLPFTAASYIKRGDLILSEVLPSPAAPIAATGEWIEVFNNLTTPVDLAGWTLELGAATHVLAPAGGSTVVPAKGFLLLGQSNVPAENDGVAVQYVYGPALALPDTAGTASLKLGSYNLSTTWGMGLGAVGASIGSDLGLYLVSTDPATAVAHPLNCTSITPFGTQTPQQLGSPGTASACFKYGLSSRAVSYKDISTTGTALIPAGANTDEAMYTVDISSAPFTHFGAAVTSLSVNTNGFIAFKTQACPGTLCFYSNKTTPGGVDPFGILAAYWDDLNHANAGSNIYSQRIAAGADPANPTAHWIIQWHKSTHFASAADSINFQVKLFDGGAMEIHFGTMTSATAAYINGGQATLWLEDPTGKVAKVIGVNQPVVTPNSAYRFTPL